MSDMHYDVSKLIARDPRFRREEVELIDTILARPTSIELRFHDIANEPGVNDETLRDILAEYCKYGVVKEAETYYCPKHRHRALEPLCEGHGHCYKCDSTYSYEHDHCRLEMIYKRIMEPDHPISPQEIATATVQREDGGRWWTDREKIREKVTDVTLTQILSAVIKFILSKLWVLLLIALFGGSSR